MFSLIVLISTRYKGCESLITLCCRWVGLPDLWACASLSSLCVPISDPTFICHVNYRIVQGKTSPGIINWEICTACWGGLCPHYWRRKCIQHHPGPFVLAFPYWLNLTIPDFFKLLSRASSPCCHAICLMCLLLAWWSSFHLSLHVFHNQLSKNKNDKWASTEHLLYFWFFA